MKSLLQEEVDWSTLHRQVLDSRFEVGRFIQAAGDHAFFYARELGQMQDLLLRIEDGEGPGAPDKLNRLREATFFDHPNVVRIYATGVVDFQNRSLLYLVTEVAELDLAESLQQRQMSMGEISNLARQVASALMYVHSENFVYCALRAGSVWRVGTQWKLADFSQIRIPGRYPLAETRKLLITPAFDAPPEANEGEVREAWDVWSLGSMLRKILLQSFGPDELAPKSNRSGSLSKVSIPPPYNRILGESLDPDPAVRITLQRLIDALSAPQEIAPEPIKPTAPTEVKEQPVPVSMPRPSAVSAPRFITPSQRAPQSLRSVALGLSLAALGVASLFGLRSLHKTPITESPARTEEVPRPAPVPTAQKATPEVAPEVRKSPFGTDAAAPAALSAPTKQAIVNLLEQWAAATRNRNVEAEISCYAPVVDKFYGQRRLSTSQLRKQEESVFARIGAVRKFEISNVQVNRVGPEWAVVSFDKAWEFGGRSRFAGSARDELVLRPVNGNWKIASQREVKVYWVDKQAM